MPGLFQPGYFFTMNVIQLWFKESGSFIEGVNLYRQTDYNAIALRQLENCLSLNYIPSGMMDLLKTELRGKMKASYVAQKESKPTNTRTEQPEEPPEVLQLRQEARKLHKRQAKVHAEMCVTKEEEIRLEQAREIMKDIIPKLDSIYDRIRSFQETGELPKSSAPDLVQEVLQKHKKYLSQKSRISRLKGYLKKKDLTPSDRQTYQKELIEKEASSLAIAEELGL